MHPLIEAVFNILLLFYFIIESFVIRLIPIKYRAKDISGQIVLVTGAGGGIGRLLALGFANLGCRVVCWDVAKQGIALFDFFYLYSFFLILIYLICPKFGIQPMVTDL